MAVQQHADIIAVSYEARRLGVTKHMPPRTIRQQYPSVKLVHVEVTLDSHYGIISYAKNGERRLPGILYFVAAAGMRVPRIYAHTAVRRLLLSTRGIYVRTLDYVRVFFTLNRSFYMMLPFRLSLFA